MPCSNEKPRCEEAAGDKVLVQCSVNVKEAFDRTFSEEEQNTVIAQLMRKAAEESNRHKQRAEAMLRLTEGRGQRRLVTEEEIRAVREEQEQSVPFTWTFHVRAPRQC